MFYRVSTPLHSIAFKFYLTTVFKQHHFNHNGMEIYHRLIKRFKGNTSSFRVKESLLTIANIHAYANNILE
jgi:hypothetical protein